MIAEEKVALREAVIASCSGTDPSGWQAPVWDALEDLGVTAVSVAESAGGAGGDLSAAATVLTALGFVGASVPLVEMDLVAGSLFEQAGLHLPGGIVTVGIATDAGLRPVPEGWLLSGDVPRVPWGQQAEHVVVLLMDEDPRWVVLPTSRATSVRSGHNVAGEPRDDLVFEEVLIPSTDVVPVGRDGVARALSRGAFGRAALMAGAAQSVFESSVRYAQERHQFGRPLAAMPVVQHMLAELAAEVCAMTVAVEAAADALARQPNDTWVLQAARVRVSAAAGTVAAVGHQIHGAMGFTQEHPLHRWTTRLWAWRDEYGGARLHSEQLGELIADRIDEPLWSRVAV